MGASVPSESIAFLRNQHAQLLLLAVEVPDAAQVAVGATLCHLCHTELQMQSSGCSVQGFYLKLLKAKSFNHLIRHAIEVRLHSVIYNSST